MNALVHNMLSTVIPNMTHTIHREDAECFIALSELHNECVLHHVTPIAYW